MCSVLAASGWSRNRLIASIMNVIKASQRWYLSSRSTSANGMPENPKGSMKAKVGARLSPVRSSSSRSYFSFSSNRPQSAPTLKCLGKVKVASSRCKCSILSRRSSMNQKTSSPFIARR